MLLKLTHRTDLKYSDLISESVMELRMSPRQEQDQHRLAFNLAIGPATTVTSYFDWLGNVVNAFTVNPFHDRIQIVATSVVEVERQAIDVRALDARWPLPPVAEYSLYDYLQFDGPVVDSPLLRQLVAQLKPREGMPLGKLATGMIDLISEEFTYQKGITTAASPITEALEKRAGVCQDFTHLMIGMARALKVPARYVSGLLHPDSGMGRQTQTQSMSAAGGMRQQQWQQVATESFRGYTQTHAWCELLFPVVGWIGMDPANGRVVGPNFVKVAIGRDFRDVPPNRGLYRGKAEERIEVSVESEALPAVPQELAAERFDAIDVPSYRDGAAYHREVLAYQQEHQQQQERFQQEQQQQQQDTRRARRSGR